MRRAPHENVATVLVAPSVLGDLGLTLMTQDLHVWPIRTAPICVDGARTAFQTRRRLVERHGATWEVAAGWVPVWISFGSRWRRGQDPLPWAAHRELWRLLDTYDEHVRFERRLGGVAPLSPPRERVAAWPDSGAQA